MFVVEYQQKGNQKIAKPAHSQIENVRSTQVRLIQSFFQDIVQGIPENGILDWLFTDILCHVFRPLRKLY